ncbi:hypothetical protein [Bradyrhizobium sp. Ai1a-2]|uniref:hypothetical protein n=1 Tax=Bradyrhizobium sp. Ai1a-2 TaxID=196490 RepID=UPI00040DC4B8|nr:hypothetical protein [Bradyrhizobium sp. Ai1a-2]
MKLDAKGRCPNCLKKPIAYQREQRFFCHRCCRSYDMKTGEQRDNWAWKRGGDGLWAATHNTGTAGDYQHAKPSAAAIRRA